jgi:hypothetical protein
MIQSDNQIYRPTNIKKMKQMSYKLQIMDYKPQKPVIKLFNYSVILFAAVMFLGTVM